MRVNDVTITRMDGASEKNRQQRDELDDAFGEQSGTLAEIDADVLSGGDGRRSGERYRGRQRRKTNTAAAYAPVTNSRACGRAGSPFRVGGFRRLPLSSADVRHGAAGGDRRRDRRGH